VSVLQIAPGQSLLAAPRRLAPLAGAAAGSGSPTVTYPSAFAGLRQHPTVVSDRPSTKPKSTMSDQPGTWRDRSGIWRQLASGLLAAALIALAHTGHAQRLEDLQNLSIEQLGDIKITSVSKTTEQLSDAPAAIYVISHDDIVRSGATTIPEILRLAPNLQVAQITASSFAISARGFNGTAASKLLVLIDGRTIYTPISSGVDWGVQDVLPEDIDRIEVISGPGAALWGANAVNGVINIITRKSEDTPGGVLDLGGGNLSQRAALQYGGKLADNLSYRVYGESNYQDSAIKATGADAKDEWQNSQGGFRLDWAPPGDRVTLQGDLYRGWEGQLAGPTETVSGQNLLVRWNHEIESGSTLQVQAYYDYSASSAPGIASDYLTTYDLDVQHSFVLGTSQQITWGGGYRADLDDYPTPLSHSEGFSPQRQTLSYANLFVQDSISLTDALKIILGARFEADAYSGPQLLPDARLSWKVTDSSLIWAAVSRAARAPSLLERDLFESVGPVKLIEPGDFRPEKLTAYQLGYRSQLSPSVSLSVSTFYNVYNDLRSAEFSPGGVFPIVFGNLMEGNTYGVEVWGSYRINQWWVLTAGANWLHKDLHFEAGSSGLGGTAIAGDDPAYQFSVHSSMNLAHGITLDLYLRKIGILPEPASPTYTEFDGRIGWAVSPSLEVSLTGANLFQPNHLEFGTTSAPLQLGATGVETGRSVYAQVRFRF
jgi:iron complex outermembrane recepter protein